VRPDSSLCRGCRSVRRLLCCGKDAQLTRSDCSNVRTWNEFGLRSPSSSGFAARCALSRGFPRRPSRLSHCAQQGRALGGLVFNLLREDLAFLSTLFVSVGLKNTRHSVTVVRRQLRADISAPRNRDTLSFFFFFFYFFFLPLLAFSLRGLSARERDRFYGGVFLSLF